MSDLYLNDKLIKQNFALGSKVNLTGLTPNTTYTLYLKDGSTTVSSKTFKTLTKINLYAVGAKSTIANAAASKNYFDKSRSNNSYLAMSNNGTEVSTSNNADWTSANFIPVPDTATGVYFTSFGTMLTSTTTTGQIAFFDSAYNVLANDSIILKGTEIERSDLVRLPPRGDVSFMKIHVPYLNNLYFFATFTYDNNFTSKGNMFLLNGNVAPLPSAGPNNDYRYHLDGSNQNTDRGTNSKGLHIREHNYYLELPLELDQSYGIYTVSGAVMGTGSYTPTTITVGLGQNGNVNYNQLSDVPVKTDNAYPYFTFQMDLEDYPANYQVLLLYPAAGGYTGSSNAKATCDFSDIRVERTTRPTLYNSAPFSLLSKYNYQIFDKINADTLTNQGSWDLQVPDWAAGVYLVASTSDLTIGTNYDFSESNNLKIDAQGTPTQSRLMSNKQSYKNIIELTPNSTNSLTKVSLGNETTNRNLVVNTRPASNRKLYLIETSNGGSSRNWAAGLYNPRNGLIPYRSSSSNLEVTGETISNYNSGKTNIICFSNKSSGNEFAQTPWFKIIPGERYMFSYIAWATIYLYTINTSIRFKTKQSSTDLSGRGYDSLVNLDNGLYILSEPNTIQRGNIHTTTFTTPSNADYAYIQIDNTGTHNSLYTADLFMGDIKICRGNNLGTFCRALEDAAPETTYKVKRIIDVDKDNHVFDYTPSDLTVNGAFLVSSPRTYNVGDTLGRDDLYNLNMLTAGSVENSNLNSLNQLHELNAVDIWFGLTNNIHDLTIRGSEPLGDWIINASNNIRGSLL